jgi:hypothetical protein
MLGLLTKWDVLRDTTRHAKHTLGNLYSNMAWLGELGHMEASESGMEEVGKVITDLYNQYQDYLVKAVRASGDYMADQWFVSEEDKRRVISPLGLPSKIPGIETEETQLHALAAAYSYAAAGSEKASARATIMINVVQTIDTAATVVGMATGVGGAAKELLRIGLQCGIKAAAKQLAKMAVQHVAGRVVNDVLGQVFPKIAEYVGIDPKYIQMGLMIYQVHKLKKMNACFVAGTEVETEEGRKPIEDIEEGDLVWSKSEETGEEGYKRVVRTFNSHPTELISLKYRAAKDSTEMALEKGESSAVVDRLISCNESDVSGELSGTKDHPFWSLTRNDWVPMGDLRIGEALRLKDGRRAEIVSLREENVPQGACFTTYNFEVEDWHTYYVAPKGSSSADLIWVHNVCEGKIPQKTKTTSQPQHNNNAKAAPPAQVKPPSPKQAPAAETETSAPKIGEPTHLARGKRAHAAEPIHPGEIREARTPLGKRMDRYDPVKAHIREIKPDNPRAIRQGEKQVKGYQDEMEKVTGRLHTTEVSPYDPDKY